MTIQRPQVEVSFSRDEVEEYTLPTELAGRKLLSALLLMGLVVLSYSPAVRGKFILSDEQNIASNFALRTWSNGLKVIWLHPAQMPSFSPLMYSSFLLEYKAFRAHHPAGYHLISILLHAISVLLLWTFLRKFEIPGALAAAAIFAVHPLNVEAVAWISQRKILLCAMFYLSAMLTYLRYVRINPAPPEDYIGLRLPRNSVALLLISHVLFVAAILSHPLGATLPVSLLIFIWWKRGTVGAAEVKRLIPMMLISAALVLMLVVINARRADASGELTLGPLAHLLMAGRAVWLYLISVIFPIGLAIAYPKWSVGPDAAWQVIFLMGVIGAMVLAWIVKPKHGRTPFAAACMFVLLLLPGLISTDLARYSFVADHAAYLASMAVIVPVTALVAQWILRVSRRSWPAVASAIVVILPFAGLTAARCMAFRDDGALWQAALAQNPRSLVALHQLGGIELEQRNDPNKAMRYFRDALTIDPQNTQVMLQIAEVYSRQGDANKAMMQFYQVLNLRPDDADAHIGLGQALNAQGQSKEALAEFHRTLELRPGDWRAMLYIGRIHEYRGDMDEAERWYRRTIQANPRDTNAYLQLALIRFYHRGDWQEAQSLLLQILDINPKNAEAYLNAGVMQFEIAKQSKIPEQKRQLFDEAAQFLGQAAALNPESAVAFKNRAIALAARSKFSDANQERISYLNQAIDAFERASALGDEEAGQLAAAARRQRDMLP